ncbi:MAG TPA: choice-of-anchor B family protein, partial [Actinomycetota bacterium]
CFVYQGPDVAHQGQSICIDSNGPTNRLVIKDVTNPAAPVRLSSTGYAGAGFTHQGWITADHRYFLLDDELDEQAPPHNTKTYVWDLLDLEAPRLIGTHVGPTTAIDHQQFIYGNFSYQSNYRAGLRILETKDIAAGLLTEVGLFDVYPPDDIWDYGGTWANYPFYRSGVVALTTMGPPYGSLAGEFFVVRPLFADLALTVTGSPDPVVLGQNVTYTFTVRNQGPTYATSATLTTRLNVGLTVISITPSQGACSATSTTTNISCNLGRIDNAGTATVTVVARVDVAGMFTGSGRAVVSNSVETDTRPGDNTASARTRVISGVLASKGGR